MTAPNVLSAQGVPRGLEMSGRESPRHSDEAQLAGVQNELAKSQEFLAASVNIRRK